MWGFEMLKRTRFLILATISPFAVLLFAFAFFVDPIDVRAVVITVGTDCPTMQECVDLAASGDTIQVPAGTYTSNITVDKPLTINGDAVNSTFLDGGATNRVISVSLGVPITLSNLTLQNGMVLGNGGGLKASARVVLDAVDLEQNSATLDGGAVWTSGQLVGTNVRVEMNSCVSTGCAGGGLYVADNLVITGTSIISGNVAVGNGGGAFTFGDATIRGVTIRNNRSDQSGGGIWANGLLNLGHSEVVSNFARLSGGGIYVNNEGWVDAGVFERNVADFEGGGLAATSHLTITDSIFSSNQAAGSGGAILAHGNMMMSGSVITGNLSLVRGGGIIAADGRFVNTTFAMNNAQVSGGGLSLQGTGIITDSSFVENDVNNRGGGLIAANLYISATQFSGNSAGNGGGGVYAEHMIRIENSQFISNLVRFSGGGVLGGTVIISGSTFLDNRCEGNPCVGAGLSSIVDLQLSRSSFQRNTSDGIGGALYIVGSSEISATALLDNYAGISGGAAFHDIASSGNYYNVLFADNWASSSGASVYLQTSGQVYLNHVTMVGRPGSLREGIWVNIGSLVIENSIITQFQTGIVNDSTAIAENNVFYDNQFNVQGMLFDPSNYIEDPGFEDPANQDYHLAFGSFSIDIARPTSLRVDFEGNVRPYANASDVGAYESSFVRDQITLQVDVNSGPYLPNQPFTYTLQYENVGVLTAENLILTNTVPAELAEVAFTSSRVITSTGNVEFTWDLGDLAAAASGVITVTGRISPGLTASGILANTLQLTSVNTTVSTLFDLDLLVPDIQFVLPTASVLETAGSITVEIDMTVMNPYRSSSVSYSTMNGTAVAGQDYVMSSGNVTFEPGDTLESIQIQILHNILAEEQESFFIVLSNSAGANLGVTSTLEILIEDTDVSVHLPVVMRP